jgi:2-phospho-L-lactate/phosphoenolpyruvate guanylyltransferase
MPVKRLWAIVPVKPFAAAKRRLAPVLDAAERASLARLMFEDVLDALMPCRDILTGVLVVTSEGDAMDVARHRGAAVVMDGVDNGINEAIIAAIDHLRPKAGDAVLVVPSDIPQITHNAFAQAAAAVAAPRSLAIAAAARDGGTNLFAGRPAGVVAPQFGPQSFERHRQAAVQAGIAVQTLCLPELSLDIDCPNDLPAFLALNSPTRAHAFLSAIPLHERLIGLAWPSSFDRVLVKVGS